MFMRCCSVLQCVAVQFATREIFTALERHYPFCLCDCIMEILQYAYLHRECIAMCSCVVAVRCSVLQCNLQNLLYTPLDCQYPSYLV